jgi:hypothetical protein
MARLRILSFIVLGQFRGYRGSTRRGLAQLIPNGTSDPTTMINAWTSACRTRATASIFSVAMSYTTQEGRERILRDLSEAAGQIELALSYLTDAYELVDEGVGDRLEAELFSPVQAAFARARRTRSEFSRRYGLDGLGGGPPPGGPRPHDARGLIDGAVDAIEQADHWIAELQDSMLPVEVGDPELRAGLSNTRELMAPMPAHARELVRTLGR